MKLRNKMFGMLLVICLVFASAIPVSAATISTQSSNTDKYSLNVESYKDWISSQNSMRYSNNYEAQIFLKEFNNLTEEEQKLFVSYISDSDLLLNVMNLLFSDKTYATLENGNIVISNSQNSQGNEIENENRAAAAIQYRVGTGSKSVSVLGLKVFEYSGEIRYSHNGSSIQEIQHANIWISQNFLPLTSFTFSDETTYGVGTSVATHVDYCTWSFVHEKFGLTYGTHQIEITGSVSNVTTFGVY